MISYLKFAIAGVLSLVVLSGTFFPAEARIRCNGKFQVQKNGNEIATPYCEDNYLAHIARLNGHGYSNYEIRQNPNKKQEACEYLRHDSRVQDICDEVLDSGFRKYR